MAAVLVVQPLLSLLAGSLSVGIFTRLAEITVAGELNVILGYAAFAAAVPLGARGASWKKALCLALAVAVLGLVLQGYVIRLLEWLAWGPNASFPTWAPLRVALPAGAWTPPPAGSDAERWADLNSHGLEAFSLLIAVLTLTGAAVGQWTARARDPIRRHVLPWVVGLALFASTRLAGGIVGAALESASTVSPLAAVFSLVSVPLAVLGTLLWARFAGAGAGARGPVEP
jgi:hypothetical protein